MADHRKGPPGCNGSYKLQNGSATSCATTEVREMSNLRPYSNNHHQNNNHHHDDVDHHDDEQQRDLCVETTPESSVMTVETGRSGSAILVGAGHGTKCAKHRGLVALVVFLALTLTAFLVGIAMIFTDKKSLASGTDINRNMTSVGKESQLMTFRCSVSIMAGPVLEQMALHGATDEMESLVFQAFQFNMQNVFNTSSFHSAFLKCFVFNLSIDTDQVILEFYLHFNKTSSELSPTTRDVEQTIAEAASGKGAIGMFVIDVSSVVITELRQCETVFMPECDNTYSRNVPYNVTSYPNHMGHLSQYEALYAGFTRTGSLESACHPSLHLYWCTVFTPPCVNARPLPPCRDFCQAIHKHCSYLPDDMSWIGDCDQFPDSHDPDVCFGQPPSSVAPPLVSGCRPLPEHTCQEWGYHSTVLPNLIGQTDVREIEDTLSDFQTVGKLRCHRYLPLLGCSALLPKCSEDAKRGAVQVPPCRQLCADVKDHCGFFMDVVGAHWAMDLDCESLPDSMDPEVCMGGLEMQDAVVSGRVPDPDVQKAFRCDGGSRVISYDWVCDGQQDCDDSTDESSCAFCEEGFQCRNFLCVDSSAVCDGVADCVTGEDEDNCVQLSNWTDTHQDQMLEIYDKHSTQWYPVCSYEWNRDAGNLACRLLSFDEMTGFRLFSIGKEIPKVWSFHNVSFKLIDSSDCASGTIVQLHCSSNCVSPTPVIDRLLPGLDKHEGGLDMEPAMWPWLVSLNAGPDSTFFCGGTLISSQHVLTAAHCLGSRTDPHGLQVLLGHTRRLSSTSSRIHVGVEKIVAHPLYSHDKYNIYADIAILKLDRPVENTKYIRPMCISNKTMENIPEGQPCVVGGWGKRSSSDADYSPVSRLRELKVVPRLDCMLKLIPHVGMAGITDRHLCASAAGSDDACNGDSGGMLLCQDWEGEWLPAGIVSWGVVCGDEDIPGVYTYLPYYLDWIEQTTRDT